MGSHVSRNPMQRYPQHADDDPFVESPPRFLLPQRQTTRSDNIRTTPRDANRTTPLNQYNNQSAHAQAMERVTFHLHSRVCNLGLQHTSHQFRTLVEHILLVLAICCAGALLMLHRTFVINIGTTTGTCLDRLGGFDPSLADVTHLVILPNNLTLKDDTHHEYHSNFEPKSRVLWNRDQVIDQPSCSVQERDDPLTTCSVKVETNDGDLFLYRLWLDQQLKTETLPIHFSYSTTKAYLMLPQNHPWWLQLQVQYIMVAHNDPFCFGEPFMQLLLWKLPFIGGGNTVLWNWLRTFPAYEAKDSSKAKKGYVYNPRTQWFQEFGREIKIHEGTPKITERSKDASSDDDIPSSVPSSWYFSSSVLSRWNKSFWIKVGVFFRASFLFFFCTTLVSFTLRETQERMLEFTQELSRRVRQSMSLSDLITTHLAQNLVFVPIMLGMMFFLIEIYQGDKVLAFGISSIVWCVEGFSLVCLRSSQGLNFFPYFFFLLFLLFHVYQSAFPDHGFVYLALSVVWSFILHSMVFFWHRYELPALVLGAVTIDRPRMNLTTASPPPPPQGQGRPRDDGDDDEFSRASSFAVASAAHHTPSRQRIDDPRLTAPLIATHPSTTTTTRQMAMSGSVALASRQSFLSNASSRRTSELYRHNQEDDSSTGSHLYFMGGEVVVHHQRSTAAANTHNGNSNESSAPILPTGNSFGNLPSVAVVKEGAVLTTPLSRNESNFSLLSSASDAHMMHGIVQNIGLDVTAGRGSGSSDAEEEDSRLVHAANVTGANYQDPFDSLANNTSMDTVSISNVTSTLPKAHNMSSSTVNYNRQDPSSDHLQAAMMENTSTPRHKNTQPDQFSSSSNSGSQCQRTPPTFPELSRHKK